MTRISQAQPLLRLTAVAAVAALALPLSGCLYAQIPAGAPTDGSTGPAQTPFPTEDEGDEASSDLPDTMTFADGAALPSTAYIEWGDGLMTDGGWTTTRSDDGNGGWEHGTVDGTCTAQFWQGFISDIPTFPGDDEATSDSMIATIIGEQSVSSVTSAATTGSFSYLVGGNAGVQNRQLSGADGDRSWVVSARAFTATGVGLSVVVDCTGGDIAATLAEVLDKNAIIIT